VTSLLFIEDLKKFKKNFNKLYNIFNDLLPLDNICIFSVAVKCPARIRIRPFPKLSGLQDPDLDYS
jgi:hypothetical protein